MTTLVRSMTAVAIMSLTLSVSHGRPQEPPRASTLKAGVESAPETSAQKSPPMEQPASVMPATSGNVLSDAGSEDDLTLATYWLVGATFLLTFVASVQAGLFLYQLRLMRVGMADTKAAADAAKETAEATKSAMLFGQRAYVSANFTPVAVLDLNQHVVAWAVVPVWTNASPTPTRNMANHISFSAFDGEMPVDWDFPDVWSPGVERTPTRLLIGPQSTVRGQDIVIDIQTVREAVAGRKVIYIWGWAAYNDVFQGTLRHITRFCNRVAVGGNPDNPQAFTMNFPIYQRYNCADEECNPLGHGVEWKPRDQLVVPTPTSSST